MGTRAEKARIACAALYFGRSVKEAASEAGVSERTVRKWQTEDWWAELWEDCEQRKTEFLAAKARGVVLQRLEEGDGTMARFVLERMDRKFAPATKKIEVQGKVNHDHRQLRNLSTPELEALLEEDDDAIDAYFEEATPLQLESE